MAMQGVAAGPGLIREHEVRRLRLEAPDHLVEVGLARADRPNKHRRLGAATGGVRHGDGIPVDVQTDEQWSRLRHG